MKANTEALAVVDTVADLLQQLQAERRARLEAEAELTKVRLVLAALQDEGKAPPNECDECGGLLFFGEKGVHPRCARAVAREVDRE